MGGLEGPPISPEIAARKRPGGAGALLDIPLIAAPLRAGAERPC